MTPARNRVTPYGELVAIPLRGAFTGNRGILHEGREVVRFHQHDSWVTCSLEYKGLRREQWVPHRMTWLFFHDEAVSLAAGHRPCALCRRADYDRYRAAWAAAAGSAPSAREMNRVLHGERIVRGTHRRRLHEAGATDLPDGVFVELDGTPHVLTGDAAVAWTHEGYAGRRAAGIRIGHRDHAAVERGRAARGLRGADRPGFRAAERRGGRRPHAVRRIAACSTTTASG